MGYEVLISCTESPVKGLNYLSKYGTQFIPDVVILGITIGNDILQSYTGLHPKGPFVLDDLKEEIHENPDSDPDIVKKSGNFPMPAQCITSPSEIHETKSVSPLEKLVSYRLIRKFIKGYEGESIISYFGNKDKLKLLDGCNGLGMFLKNPPREIEEAYTRLFRILKMYETLSRKHNFRLILILFPQRFQVQKEDWTATKRDYRLKEECFDLIKPNNEILHFCMKNDLICIDPTQDMAKIYDSIHKSLYFPLGDMHMNALGNNTLYSTIKDKVYAAIPLKK